jgi:putative transcriptional regulator
MKEWRKREGLSQVWLAAKAGTTQRVISLIETGKYNPSLELLERLAKAMDSRLEVAFKPQSR